MNKEIQNRITPDLMTKDEIIGNGYFVFGSNESGLHGGGAARFAHKELGAKWGVAEGETGWTYALPTVGKKIKRTLSVDEIRVYADNFIQYAKDNPDKQFYLTEVGCGLAGLKVKDIAPLFKECMYLKNVTMPRRFWGRILTNI